MMLGAPHDGVVGVDSGVRYRIPVLNMGVNFGLIRVCDVIAGDEVSSAHSRDLNPSVDEDAFEMEARQRRVAEGGTGYSMDRERPPIRKIDMFLRPDCPCCNMSKRYTMAILVLIVHILAPTLVGAQGQKQPRTVSDFTVPEDDIGWSYSSLSPQLTSRNQTGDLGLAEYWDEGFLISFGIRCNIGVAIVEMTEVESIPFGNETTIRHPLIDWSKDTIGIIESSFFWGYLITQVPGGFLASMYPASWLFGIAIFSSSCLNMLVPTAARLHPFLAVVVRVAQGIVE
ncbi:unnamed protein product, partial [Cyprideis torosa]